MRQYETTFIIDTHLPDEAIEKTIEKYKNFITGDNGVVNNIDRWGKRRLAYEIKKKQYGYYVCLRFEAEGSFIEKLAKEFKLDDSILRYLTLLVPKSLLQEEARQKARKESKIAALETTKPVSEESKESKSVIESADDQVHNEVKEQ
ncbi:30S ribosomal protein S6 [bacterium]|nr:30S ribosomal protein S6 [bacterium]